MVQAYKIRDITCCSHRILQKIDLNKTASVVEPACPFTTTSLFREADISIVSAVSTRSWTDKEWFEMVEMK